MRSFLLCLFILTIGFGTAWSHIDPSDPRYENTLAKDFIMDAPWRVIDANTPIPVTIIIKDCDVDDVRELHWIKIWDETNGEAIIWNHDFNDERLGNNASEENFWTYITKVTEGHSSLPNGTALTPANLGYSTGDNINLKVSIYYKDDWFNYTETRHLRVNVGSGPFPWPAHWYGGDVHYHTMYTNNIYEYGAPLPAVKQTALAMGLNWLTATDHSCDLDETGDGEYSYATQEWEYTLQDVDGTFTHYRDVASHGSSWNSLGADVDDLDCPEFRLYRAVELNMASVDAGTLGKTLHCLIYNDEYIHSPDSGAPGERPVSPNLHNALDEIQGDGFAYSAHPLSDLSGVFLGFDFGANGAIWGMENIDQALTHEAFRGLQIFNTRSTVTSNDQNNPWNDFDNGNAIENAYPDEFLDGLQLWDELLSADLAAGHQRPIFIAGGSDAHGDFNFSSHMAFDDFAEDNGIGKAQTVAFVPGNWNAQNLPPVDDILAAYRAGHTIITDGPFLELGIDTNGNGNWYDDGDFIVGSEGVVSPNTNANIHLRWASLAEFGPVSQVRLLAITATESMEIASLSPENPYSGSVILPLADFDFPNHVALRAELLTNDGLAGHRACTNPVWIHFDNTVAADPTPRPNSIQLSNTPNPFNPQTKISFELAQNQTISLDVFASDGRLVCTLISNQRLSSGQHEYRWNGKDAAGREMPSGVYLYRVQTPEKTWQNKMSLVR